MGRTQAVLCLLAGMFVAAMAGAWFQDDDLCLTRNCISPAQRLLKYMNRSIDPCQDFYQFACGRFLSTTSIPSDKSRYSNFDPALDEIYERGRLLLEQEASDDDFESDQLARTHYKACMNQDQREQDGVKPLQKKLEDIGGWPVLQGEQWDKNNQNFTWWEQTYKMNEEGLPTGILLSVNVFNDNMNTSQKALYMDQASLGLAREYLVKGFDDEDVQNYFNYIIEIAMLLGTDRVIAERELKASLLFEIDLAMITEKKEDRRNAVKRYNPTTTGALKTFPGLPPSWTSYVQHLFAMVNYTITDDERIIVNSFEYLEQLSDLVSKTSSRTIANYMGWRAAKASLGVLNEAARDIQRRFTGTLTGSNTSSPAWKRCVDAVGFGSYSSTGLVYVAGSMYLRTYFKPEAKKLMLEMTHYIKEAFREDILQKLDWMDENTKARALMKLNKMKHIIGYSDELIAREKIDDLHKGLALTQTDFFDNSFKLSIFWRIFNLKKLKEKNPRESSWIDNKYVAVVNAFYSPSKNYMEFPAGILQGSFFNLNAPNYMNFGAIGSVIGHELTHGFDDQGKQRNEDGDLENWWAPETEQMYKDKAQCIIDQYSSYFDEQADMNLNGINTQGENIADNGAIKEAFYAYLRWIKKNGDEKKLPGLSYTPKQLFFISFAQIWCSKYHDGALRRLILTGNHAPGRYRVIGSLSNNKDFANEFNCPLGSKMNPVDKCSVW